MKHAHKQEYNYKHEYNTLTQTTSKKLQHKIANTTLI